MTLMADEEEKEYTKRYHREKKQYEAVSRYIMRECMIYKEDHPKSVRVIFSREPEVKELSKIFKKIELKRKEGNGNLNYEYDDLTDLIALTVLCPFHKDVDEFISWMQNSFTIVPQDDDPLRDDPLGHRGYHYIVQVLEATALIHPKFNKVKCEIQIKTILEDAFDAKTHDLTYKPGPLGVDPELKDQFGILSSSLRCIDKQSEFIRNLILKEENERTLRRETSILYLFERDEDVPALSNELSINIDQIKSENALEISQKLKEASSPKISSALCKLAVLCALKLDNDLLKQRALDYINGLTNTSKTQCEVYLVRSTLKWALGYFENAIGDTMKAISIGLEESDPDLTEKNKSNFVYFVSDWKSLTGQEKKEWTSIAAGYVRELDATSQPRTMDTVGFYWVTFGDTYKEIDDGRQLIQKSWSKRSADESVYEYFHKSHDRIALKRLLDKST